MNGIANLGYDCDGGNGIGAKFSEVRDKTSYLACVPCSCIAWESTITKNCIVREL